MDILIEKIKSFLRPVKRVFDEDILDRMISLSINKKRVAAEKEFHSPEDKQEVILFNAQYHWYYSWVDYTIAAALKYRGYKPVVFICDGLPYCEYETSSITRPDCARCYRLTKRHVDVFGLQNYKLSEMLNESVVDESKNIAYGTPVALLGELEHEDVNIGEIAHRNYIHYLKGVHDITPETEGIFRKCIHSALLINNATIALTKKIEPSRVITPNGKFIQSGISIEVAKNFKLPYYTWDVFTQHTATTFAKNEVAHNQKVDDVWDDIKSEDLTEKQKNELKEFFNLQSRSENTPYQYYGADVIEDANVIKKELGLRTDSRIISLFPNVEWDSTAMGLNGPYKSMHDWVFSMIGFAKANPDFDLIVRAHPGELKVPYNLRTSTPICDVIRAKAIPLPSNIHLIDATDDISSYTLAAMSEVVMVYTSTLGIEFALDGIRAWVAAKSYYAGKGFTLDIINQQHVETLLKEGSVDKFLNDDELELAKKLAYAVKFKRAFSYPLFDPVGKFFLNDYERLFPGNDVVIDNICDFIEDKRSYMDLGPLNT